MSVLEDALYALNTDEWSTASVSMAFYNNRSQNRAEQLRQQVGELVQWYSLSRLFPFIGQDVKEGKLLDALCLGTRQLLGLTGCWLLNGPVVMASSEQRTHDVCLPEQYLPDKAGVITGDHPLWQALSVDLGHGQGWVLPCHIVRQTGGWILYAGDSQPLDLLKLATNVISLSLGLQQTLWQAETCMDDASESQLQQFRVELTEWIAELSLRQAQMLQQLANYLCRRQGIGLNHPQRVGLLAYMIASRLDWAEPDMLLTTGHLLPLEGAQWSKALQGQHPWTEEQRHVAEAQKQLSWSLLTQFFPLANLPAPTPQDSSDSDPQPEETRRLLQMVRVYCALTEVREYRVKPSALSPEQALNQLRQEALWPDAWVTILQDFVHQAA